MQSLVCCQTHRIRAENRDFTVCFQQSLSICELCHLSSNNFILLSQISSIKTTWGAPSYLEHRAKPYDIHLSDQLRSAGSQVNSSWKVKQQQTKAVKPVRSRKKIDGTKRKSYVLQLIPSALEKHNKTQLQVPVSWEGWQQSSF